MYVVCSVDELGERESEAKRAAWARPGQRSRRIADKPMLAAPSITDLRLHSTKSTGLSVS